MHVQSHKGNQTSGSGQNIVLKTFNFNEILCHLVSLTVCLILEYKCENCSFMYTKLPYFT